MHALLRPAAHQLTDQRTQTNPPANSDAGTTSASVSDDTDAIDQQLSKLARTSSTSSTSSSATADFSFGPLSGAAAAAAGGCLCEWEPTANEKVSVWVVLDRESVFWVSKPKPAELESQNHNDTAGPDPDLLCVYWPIAHSDHQSVGALATANDIMSRLRLPGELPPTPPFIHFTFLGGLRSGRSSAG